MGADDECRQSDVARPTGRRSPSGSRARTGDGDGPRLDRRPHHLRSVRRRARRTDDDLSRWTGAGSAPAATRPNTRSSGTSRTSPPWSTPSPPAPAGRSPCGATPTAPTAPWAAPRCTANVHHLVLYEPSLGIPYPPGSIDRIEAALATGDHDAAIVAVLVDILEMTDEEIDDFRVEPAVARASGRGADHPEGVPRRGGLGVPARPVRRDHRADADADRLRQRARRRPRRRAGGGRDPRTPRSACSTATPTSPTGPTRRWSPRSSSGSPPGCRRQTNAMVCHVVLTWRGCR